MGWQPVAVVQYTFTHKQHTEQHNLAFALQKYGNTSVMVAEGCQLALRKQNIGNRTHITIIINKHNNENT